MVNGVLGRRPTQLERIFQDSQPQGPTIQPSSHPTSNNLLKPPSNSLHPTQFPPVRTQPSDPIADISLVPPYRTLDQSIKSLSIDPSSPPSSLPNVPFQFSVPGSRHSSNSLPYLEDPSHRSIQVDLSPQSITDYDQIDRAEALGEAQESLEEQDGVLINDQVPILIPSGCNMERLRFVRDSRLDEIIEETEPSSSSRTSWKHNNKSQASQASDSDVGSRDGSFKPPSIPFAHRTPIIVSHHHLGRADSDVRLSDDPHPPYTPLPSENQSTNKSDFSTGQRRFRFTYDTFTRKHLNRLAEEINGLSANSTSLLRRDAPIKIKSILGSPGEEVTDSSTSIGLAHSTPPDVIHSSTNYQPRTFQAGRTPFKPVTSLTRRWKEEKDWTESFVEPNSYAIDSVSPVIGRKSYQRTSSHPPKNSLCSEDVLSDSQTSVVPYNSRSCRSSKRIRLESSPLGVTQQLRKLSDSLTSERNPRRRPPPFTRAHPMVVFKSSTATTTTPSTPQDKQYQPQACVRDRLAEAKALMDRIRAKTSAPQELDPIHPRDSQIPQTKMIGGGSIRESVQHSIQHSSSLRSEPPGRDFVDSGGSSVLVEDLPSCSAAQDCPTASNPCPPLDSDAHAPMNEFSNVGNDPTELEDHESRCSQKHSEAELDWDISIEEDIQYHHDQRSGRLDKRQDNLTGRADVSNDPGQLESSNSFEIVQRRLASTAIAFLRQTLGDANMGHSNGQENSDDHGALNLPSTSAPRRQFTHSSIPREPIGRVTHDANDQLTRSNAVSSHSTHAPTSTSAPTPALTSATTTQNSSTNSQQSQRHWSGGDSKNAHQQKFGLMTIAPCDVEDLFQNARVGNMVFDSTIGKWVKIRSQSDTGVGTAGKCSTADDHHLHPAVEHQLGESITDESSDEEDIFKDIESLNSKRASDSSQLDFKTYSSVDSSNVKHDVLMDQIDLDNQNRGIERNEAIRSSIDRKVEVGFKEAARRDLGLLKYPNNTNEKFKPKSVLKVANGDSPNRVNASMVSSSTTDESAHIVSGLLKPSRSVSFQDGRKNGKIIGLSDGASSEEETRQKGETISTNKDGDSVGSGQKEKRRGSLAQDAVDSKSLRPNPENESHNSLHQTSLILMNSVKKKVRRKSSSSSNTPTTTTDTPSSTATPSRQNRPLQPCHDGSHQHLSITTTNSNLNSNHLIDDYSFELNYSKLIKIITDFEPFEPFWNSIKTINLSNKLLDSVIKLKEILPFLDQIDLSSNQLTYLTGLPSSIRMLIASNNQINELCSFNHLQNLERLDLTQNGLTNLEQLCSLKHLRELKLDHNAIDDLSGLHGLDALVKLSVKSNRLKKVDFEHTHWNNLQILNLDRNQICEVTGLHHLKSVYLLNLDRNQLYSLTIDEPMPNLRVLRVNENRLETLNVSKLVNLRTLYIDNNDLIEITGANRLRKLENLSVRDQRGGELSLPLKHVRDVKRIYLGGNPIPAAFPSCQFYNLLYLELAMCQCQNLPADFATLIPNIRTLNLNYNFIKDLSPLMNLRRLERLSVVGSRIKSVDRGLLAVLESLPELELLDLRQNPLCGSFYPPLLLKSTPSTSVVTGRDRQSGLSSSAAAPHLNQYQIVIKDEEENEWQSIDDRFRKSLPNEFYLKRMTYRSLILKSCRRHDSKGLKYLDGIKVQEAERKKVDRFLRGLSRKLDPTSNHQPSSSSTCVELPSRTMIKSRSQYSQPPPLTLEQDDDQVQDRPAHRDRPPPDDHHHLSSTSRQNPVDHSLPSPLFRLEDRSRF